MQRFLIYSMLFLLSCKTFAQLPDKNPYAQPTMKFYKSYQNYKKGEVLHTYQVNGVVTEHGVVYFYDSLRILENNEVKYVTPKDFPSNLFSDNDMFATRYFEGKYYAILSAGRYCYYMDIGYITFMKGIEKGKIHTFPKSLDYYSGPKHNYHYYSNGENGQILSLTNEVLYPLLDRYKLVDKYNISKKEIGITEFNPEFSEVYVEMFRIINKKVMEQ